MKYLLLLLLSSSALAGGVYIKGGVSNVPGDPTRAGFFGYQANINSLFFYQLELGGYVADQGATRGIASTTAGIQYFTPFKLYTKLSSGPAFLTASDSRLGGMLQFNTDLEIGVQVSDRITVGFDYKHLSNANITIPNLGRDFLMLKLQMGL